MSAKNKKVVVTGGCGFIGSHLTERLLAEEADVTIIDNLVTGKMTNLSPVRHHPKLNVVKADIRKPTELTPHFDNIDWVFHLAALADIVPSIETPRDYYETNVDGTFNVLEASRKANAKRFVYTASSSCYGVPDQYPTPESAPIKTEYPYALTKALGEQLVMHWHQVYGLNAVSLRLFNVYGPRARSTGQYGAVFGVFLAQKLSGKPLTIVGDGTQTRDFTYVTDVADAFFTAAKSPVSGEIFNVGSGNAYEVNELVKLLNHPTTRIPKRPGEPDCTQADIRNIKSKLNWQTKVSFKDGVKKMLDTIGAWKDAPVWTPDSIETATKSWFKYLEK